MSIIDYLRNFNSPQAGQKRRQFLEEMFDFEEYIPPNLRPLTQFVLDANPVTGMENSITESRIAFDPERTPEERRRAGLNMMMEVGVAAAPAVLGRLGYLTTPAAVAETFATPTITGEGIRDATSGLLQDLQYAGRSIADADPRGVLEAFQTGGQPQALSAGVMGSNMGPPMIDDAFQYSPTTRALADLKQDKGTYEQLKAMAIKGGAKPEEFEWSGLDSQFRPGDKVSKDLLRMEFERNRPQMEVIAESAAGGGTLNVGIDELATEVMDNVFDRHRMTRNNRLRPGDLIQNEIGEPTVVYDPLGYVMNNILTAENSILRRNYGTKSIKEFPIDDDAFVNEYAQLVGITPSHLMDLYDEGKAFYNFHAPINPTDPDSVKHHNFIFDTAEDALEAQNPMAHARVMMDAESEVRRQFMQDPPLFLNALRENDPLGTLGESQILNNAMAQNFDPGKTLYSDFFPGGAANYTEKKFYYNPKDGKTLPYLGKADHYGDGFGEGLEGLLITGRTGDYEVFTPHGEVGPEGLETSKVRYLGEIQSDVGQGIERANRDLNIATPLNYEETALMPEFKAAQLAERDVRHLNPEPLFGTGLTREARMRLQQGRESFRQAGVKIPDKKLLDMNFKEIYSDLVQINENMGLADGPFSDVIFDNILAHNFVRNAKEAKSTRVLTDWEEEPFYVGSLFADAGMDINDITHKDVLDIVFNQRQPLNEAQEEAFDQIKLSYNQQIPDAFRDYLFSSRQIRNQKQPFWTQTLGLFGDFVRDNDKFYFKHIESRLPEETAMELGDGNVKEIFDGIGFNELRKYTDEVGSAALKTAKLSEKMASARSGGRLNVYRNPTTGQVQMSREMKPAGPLMKREKDWAPFVIRKELIDAVNDDADVFAIPSGRESLSTVMGNINPESVKDGTLNFYQKNVQNYIFDILKKVDKKFAKQAKEDLAKGPFSLNDKGQKAVGFRLTPELKAALREKGLPTFGVAGGIGLTNFMLQDEQQPPSLLGGI